MSAGPAGPLLVASVLVAVALCAVAVFGFRSGRERPFWRGVLALTVAPLGLTLVAALVTHMAGLHYVVMLGPAFSPTEQALVDGWSSTVWGVGLATWVAPLAIAAAGLARSAAPDRPHGGRRP